MAKKTLRPGRTLLVFGLSILVLYGLAALGGTWKPRLGLDLEGGTRITLSADPEGGAITPAKLKQAAAIVEARANGSGVSESEVTTQGDRNIIVEIPGRNATSLVDAVKRTAQLRFRIVAGQPQPGTPAAQPSESASPSSSPSPSGKADGGNKQNKTDKKQQTPSAGTASPNPRPAPFADPTPTTKTPTGKQTPSPSAQPSAPPASQAPQPTVKGASVDNPVEWAQNPGQEWLQKFATYTCPDKGDKAAAPVKDNAGQPLITCNEDGLKFLLSKAVIEGTELKSASYGIPQNGSTYAVNLGFKGSAPKVFGDVSTKLYQNGGTFAIVLDGQVISYAGVNQPILDGNAQITGDFTEGEARALSNSLKYGALPLKFTTSVETIGPSLAGDQLSAGIYAGIAGLLIVMLYCLLYYRGLGLVVIASLVAAAIITYGVVLVLAKTAGFTLTLPGIAGLIVAVGITADSFIVYFERIRDDMRDGRSMRVAVETGWARARNTCLAADAVSILAAIVLYIFAIGVVRGFAFALGVSTLIDIAVFFWFTKPMMTLLARRTFFNTGRPLSGLSPETLGIDTPTPDARLAGGRA